MLGGTFEMLGGTFGTPEHQPGSWIESDERAANCQKALRGGRWRAPRRSPTSASASAPTARTRAAASARVVRRHEACSGRRAACRCRRVAPEGLHYQFSPKTTRSDLGVLRAAEP